MSKENEKDVNAYYFKTRTPILADGEEHHLLVVSRKRPRRKVRGCDKFAWPLAIGVSDLVQQCVGSFFDP